MKNKMLFSTSVFLILGLVISCGQGNNSQDGDDIASGAVAKPTTVGARPSEVRFNKALTVLKERCVNCHYGYHKKWEKFETEKDWLNSKVVNAGNGPISLLITKLKNVGGNMPLDNPEISEQEYQDVLDWIENMEMD